MKRFLIPVAGLGAALVLAVGIFAAGGLAATSALASGTFMGGHGPWSADHADWAAQLPPELRGLSDIPAADRFDHFKGVTINLTDKNNQPLAVTVTPGKVTSISSTSLSLAANDGSTRSFALDANTIEKGKSAPANSDKVVVVTLNGSTTATAVVDLPQNVK
jgi:hypothetical protein